MSFPLPLTDLPAFEPLMRGALWRQWADSGKVFPLQDLRSAVHYVRLKPATSCRVAIFRNGTRSAQHPPIGFLLYLYPDLPRARAAYEKVAGRPSFPGSSPYRHFLDEHAVVAIPFPNDAEVPGLRHFYRDSRLRRALYEVLPECPESSWNIKKSAIRRDLLAYKPGRRAVYRVDVRLDERAGERRLELPMYVRVETPASYRTGFDKLAAIGTALPSRAAWRVPRTRGTVDERWITVRDWIEGDGLDTRLVDDVPFETAGAALAGLHALDLDLGRGMTRLSARELSELGLDLAQLVPADAGCIRDLAERLVELAAFLSDPRSAVVHGDFHLGQIVLADDGPVMVDLDRAGSGHPLCDLGSFLAHLEELGAHADRGAAFIEGYARAAGAIPESNAIRVATAAALFRRSMLPFRQLSPTWPEQIRGRLDRIEELLEVGVR